MNERLEKLQIRLEEIRRKRISIWEVYTQIPGIYKSTLEEERKILKEILKALESENDKDLIESCKLQLREIDTILKILEIDVKIKRGYKNKDFALVYSLILKEIKIAEEFLEELREKVQTYLEENLNGAIATSVILIEGYEEFVEMLKFELENIKENLLFKLSHEPVYSFAS